MAVPGRVEGDVVEVADLFKRQDGELVRADGYPGRREAYAQAGFDLTELLGKGQ